MKEEMGVTSEDSDAEMTRGHKLESQGTAIFIGQGGGNSENSFTFSYFLLLHANICITMSSLQQVTFNTYIRSGLLQITF